MPEMTTAASNVRGRAWVFGDNVNTDILHPPRYYSLDPSIVKAGLFKGIDESLQQRVRPGDIIVAGKNFGCGSSRETSIQSLKLNGIVAVVAEDFARIFFRNATNNGIPCLSLVNPSELGRFGNGEEIGLCLEEDCLEIADGGRISVQPASEFVRRIWAAQGLLGLLPC